MAKGNIHPTCTKSGDAVQTEAIMHPPLSNLLRHRLHMPIGPSLIQQVLTGKISNEGCTYLNART